MFIRSPTEIITKTWQTIGAKTIMIIIFFTTRKLIVLNVLLKGSKFNWLYLSGFEENKLEFSLSDITDNLLGVY